MVINVCSVRTYVGCTAKGAANVTQCVVSTAQRINFVPIGFQIDSNGNECPNPNKTILHIAGWSVGEFFIFLLFENHGFWRRLWARRKNKNIVLRSRTFHVNVIGFWASLAIEILEDVVMVGLILSKQGYQTDMMKNFVIFAIRPRPAFFNALLGYYDSGWAPGGLTDMVTQIILSLFGGYLALFGAISATHTTNPMRPNWWKAYLAGGALASVVTSFVWIYIAIMCILLTFICCGSATPLAYMAVLPLQIIWFTITSVLGQLKLIVQNFYHVIIRRRKYREVESEMVLTFNNSQLKTRYHFAMLTSLILLIGSWMFWVGFLRLSGDLYCPQELPQVDLIVISFYLALVLVRKAFAFLLGEQEVIEQDTRDLQLKDFTQLVG
jgi:hypothetical protein